MKIKHYEKGRKVIITPARSESLLRDAQLEPYAGKVGVITGYHWIQPTGLQRFYLYTVHVQDKNVDIILHEDELRPYLK